MSSARTRRELVLNIVDSDKTFSYQKQEHVWVGKCLHCSTKLFVSEVGDTQATIEHIVPQSAGGSDDMMNLALACKACNNEKGVRHDPYYPRDPRASEVIATLMAKRAARYRDGIE